MIQAYSYNEILVPEDIIKFNNVKLRKGCTTTLNGATTFQFNKSGVYEVNFEISGVSVGEVRLYMTKNGVVEQSTVRTITGTTEALGFSTSITDLVQVPQNNSCRCCDEPTTVKFINAGVNISNADVNVVITKIC